MDKLNVSNEPYSSEEIFLEEFPPIELEAEIGHVSKSDEDILHEWANAHVDKRFAILAEKKATGYITPDELEEYYNISRNRSSLVKAKILLMKGEKNIG